MKNSLDGTKWRLDSTGKCISKLEDRSIENTQMKTQREIKGKTGYSKSVDSMKWSKIYGFSAQEVRERENGAEEIIEEITVENFPTLMSQEAQWNLNRKNTMKKHIHQIQTNESQR